MSEDAGGSYVAVASDSLMRGFKWHPFQPWALAYEPNVQVTTTVCAVCHCVSAYLLRVIVLACVSPCVLHVTVLHVTVLYE